MCYISLSMLVSWCLNLEEEKNGERGNGGRNVIISIFKFILRWLPMAFIIPLLARSIHKYFHKYFMTVYLGSSYEIKAGESSEEEVYHKSYDY